MQAAQSPASVESRRHSKLEPGLEDSNSKLGEALLVGPAGPAVIVVSGAAVSIVKELAAGLGSTLPTASLARTSKLWAPSLRAL